MQSPKTSTFSRMRRRRPTAPWFRSRRAARYRMWEQTRRRATVAAWTRVARWWIRRRILSRALLSQAMFMHIMLMRVRSGWPGRAIVWIISCIFKMVRRRRRWSMGSGKLIAPFHLNRMEEICADGLREISELLEVRITTCLASHWSEVFSKRGKILYRANSIPKCCHDSLTMSKRSR